MWVRRKHWIPSIFNSLTIFIPLKIYLLLIIDTENLLSLISRHSMLLGRNHWCKACPTHILLTVQLTFCCVWPSPHRSPCLGSLVRHITQQTKADTLKLGLSYSRHFLRDNHFSDIIYVLSNKISMCMQEQIKNS